MFLATKVTVENWKVNATKVTVRKLNVYCRQSYSKKVECLLQPPPKVTVRKVKSYADKVKVRKLNVSDSQSYSKKVKSLFTTDCGLFCI